VGRRRKEQPGQTTILDPENGEPLASVDSSSGGLGVHLRDDLPAAKSVQRLAVPLTEDGRADTSGMRAETREKLKRMIADEGLARELGLRDTSEPAPALFSEQDIGFLYDSLGSLEAWAFQLLLKIPAPIANKCFLYTREEKQLLAPATVAVLSKHASGWMVQYKDECLLALLLVSIHRAKVETALRLAKETRDAQARHDAEESQRSAKPNGQDAHLGALEQ
jgi:hypothetical protein